MKKIFKHIQTTKFLVALSLMVSNGLCVAQSLLPVLVKDINVGSGSSSPQFLEPFAGKLYFGTNNVNGLWMTDGTDAGTILADGINTIGNDFVSDLLVFNGQLFFNTFSTPAWWSTTGGVDNAVQIKSAFNAFEGTPYNSTTLASTVLMLGGQDFSVSGSSPFDLYRSDGTSVGTVAVGNFMSDIGGSRPGGFWKVGSKFLFSATETATGVELYSTDATTGSTQMIKDIAPGVGSSLSDVSGAGGVVLGNELYIPAFSFDPPGTKLWRSDGTNAGTVAIYDTVGFGNGTLTEYDTPRYLTVFNGSVYFFATAGGISPRQQLWKVTTGERHPTQITFDPDFIPPSGSFGCVGSLQPMILANTMYFPREDNTNGCELWSSDGTSLGTQMVKDINPGGTDSFPTPMATFNGELFFTALKAGFGFELWHTDGKTVGTLMVSDLNPGTASSILNYQMQEYNGELYFIAEDGMHGQELYKLTTLIIDPIFKDGFELLGPI